MASSDAQWERLGELLLQRRAQLDPRYGRRTRFADERHLDYRIAYEVEKARRHNFGDGTLAAIEAAYELAPGSIMRTVAGGPLEPRPGAGHEGATGHDRLRAVAGPEPPIEPAPASVPVSFDMVTQLVRPALITSATAIRAHAEAVLARNPAARGADIFPGEPDLASQWDLTPALPVERKSWYAAIARFGRSEAKSGLA
jgi:hypothetical protein